MAYGYLSNKDYKLVGYIDGDCGSDRDERKSTSNYVFFMGNINFTWMSEKHPIAEFSTCEVEYISFASCICNAV